jgi:hypothetical protein
MEYVYDSNTDSLLPNPDRDSSAGLIESGFIAQEVFYNIPEWRHLVHVPQGVDPIIYSSNVTDSTDPQKDPKEYYKYWGSNLAMLNYTGIIPYIVDGMQEQQRMIEQHKNADAEVDRQLQEAKSTIYDLQQTIAEMNGRLSALEAIPTNSAKC